MTTRARRLNALCALPLAAAAPASLAQGTAVSPGIGLAHLGQIGLALGLVLAIIFATGWLARRGLAGRGLSDHGLKVVGGIALGTRERAVLIETGNCTVLVGITPGRLQTLCVMDREGHHAPRADAFAAELERATPALPEQGA